MNHQIKIREEYADAVLSGEKSFEVRENDRNYQKGDTVQFQVVDNLSFPTIHPLNYRRFLITYVLSGWGLKDNWVAFSIKQIG